MGCLSGGEDGGVCFSLVLGGGCLVREGRRRVRGVGVVEGYCCFVVVECFLEGCGQFEFVVELVDVV